MIDVLQTLTVILSAGALTPALAHAFALPGRLRLTKEAYGVMQPISSPGLTIAGLREPLGILATLFLLVLTPPGHTDFWLTRVALLGLLGMQTGYGLWTPPVHNVWLQGEPRRGLGARFFAVGATSRPDRERTSPPMAWTALLIAESMLHVVRAGLASLSSRAGHRHRGR